MKCIIAVVFSMVVLCSCTQNNALYTKDSFDTRLDDIADVHEKILAFQEIVNRNLRWRTDAISFYSSISRQTRYSNREILLLHKQGTDRYIQLRTELLNTISRLEWVTDENVRVTYTEQPTHFITEKYTTRANSKSEPKVEERTIVYLNPNDDKGITYIKEAKLGLAAALLLYDNYILAISHYNELEKTRQLLNFDHQHYSRYLDEVASSYFNPTNYLHTARAISLFNQEVELERVGKITPDEDNDYLNLLIEGSYTFDRISKDNDIGLLTGNMEILAIRLADMVENSSDYFTYYLGSVFSNVIGLIETRKGKMTMLDNSEKQRIEEQLQPLDILLEKTPFRLTDKTIPGYWGHVAIWVGNKADLERLGIWQHPLVKPHQWEIVSNKRHIVEALLPGVQINSLEHFLNIDDLAVLRPVGLTEQERREAVLRAFAQLGKEYDFNFDVETNKRIVCSEIAYAVFNNYDWTTNRILGRETISPDNVVQFARKTKLFTTVQLYLDGSMVTQDLEHQMESLIQK